MRALEHARPWRPQTRAIASRIADSTKRPRNAASWITFATWCGVSTALRSTSRRWIEVTGMRRWLETSRGCRLRARWNRSPGRDAVLAQDDDVDHAAPGSG